MNSLVVTVGLLLFAQIALGQGGRILPNDTNIQYIGRVQKTLQGMYRMDWPGVQLATNFQGSSLRVFLSDETKNTDGQTGFNIFIDGKEQLLQLQYGTSSYQVASGLRTGVHSLLITKRTEPLISVTRFEGFQLDSGAGLLAPSPRPQRRIEFIGDSITCGYGDEGKAGCHFSAATENNYLTYGPLIARELEADIYVEAWSGRGMVRNYGDKNITSAVPLPKLYPRILANEVNTKWDFKQWSPHAIVINLGTNDYSTEPFPPRSVFEQGYQNFINLLRTKYGWSAKIFAVCGPLIGDPCCQYVKEIADANLAHDVYYIDMQKILTDPDDYGCDGHPNVAGHKKMANVALPIIKESLGW